MIRKYKKGRMLLLGKKQVTSRILVLREKTVNTSIEVLLVVGNMFSKSTTKSYFNSALRERCSYLAAIGGTVRRVHLEQYSCCYFKYCIHLIKDQESSNSKQA